MPEEGMAVEGLLDLMCRYGVTSISATPSYWRRLVALGHHESLKAVPLEQITLGGEAADQQLLSVLNRLYPRAAWFISMRRASLVGAFRSKTLSPASRRISWVE